MSNQPYQGKRTYPISYLSPPGKQITQGEEEVIDLGTVCEKIDRKGSICYNAATNMLARCRAAVWTPSSATRGFMSAPPFAGAHSGIHRAVIPVAGLGTRLRPLTDIFPKELLPVGRKPALAHITAELREAGITHVLFVVSARKPQIRAFFGEEYVDADGGEPLHCDYAVQESPRGSGDAVLCAESWVGDAPFVVAFGDCLFEGVAGDPAAPLRRLIATHQAQRAAASILVETVAWEKVSRYGIVAPERPVEAPPEAAFALADIVEKPARESAPSNLAVAARFVLEPDIFAFLRSAAADARGEFNLPDAIRALGRTDRPLWAEPLRAGEKRRDIGNFEDYFAAFVAAALRDAEYGGAARRTAEGAMHCAARREG